MQVACSSTLAPRCPARFTARTAAAAAGVKPVRCRNLLVRSSLMDIAPQVAATANEVAKQSVLQPGSVDAPGWVLPVAAVVVAIALSFSSFLLKPGTEQAEEVFKRDAKRIGNQARAAGQKTRQTIRGKR